MVVIVFVILHGGDHPFSAFDDGFLHSYWAVYTMKFMIQPLTCQPGSESQNEIPTARIAYGSASLISPP